MLIQLWLLKGDNSQGISNRHWMYINTAWILHQGK